MGGVALVPLPPTPPGRGRSRGAREGLWANRGLQTWACEGAPLSLGTYQRACAPKWLKVCQTEIMGGRGATLKILKRFVGVPRRNVEILKSSLGDWLT